MIVPGIILPHPGPSHPSVTYPGPSHPSMAHPGPSYPSVIHPGPNHPSMTYPAPSHPLVIHSGPNPYCVPQQPHSELREVCCTCSAATSHMRTLNSAFIDFHLPLFPMQSEAYLPCPRIGWVPAHPVLGEALPQVSPLDPIFWVTPLGHWFPQVSKGKLPKEEKCLRMGTATVWPWGMASPSPQAPHMLHRHRAVLALL